MAAEDREAELAGRRAELAQAIQGRPHWQLEGVVAVYARPGTTRQIRVRAILGERPRDRFIASIVIANKAEHARPAGTAVEAIRWAENVRLD